MLKHVMAAAAVSAFALTSALAQQTSPPASSPSPPPAAAPSTPSPSASATTPSTAATGKFVTKQSPDQHLTSKFKGTDVVGSDDKKIGDVSDILFDKDKKILAYIVGVGGFLGIGSKDVAVEPASFQMVPGSSATDFKLRLSMTADELKAAPAFEPYKDAASGDDQLQCPGDPPDGRAGSDGSDAEAVSSVLRVASAAPILIGAAFV